MDRPDVHVKSGRTGRERGLMMDSRPTPHNQELAMRATGLDLPYWVRNALSKPAVVLAEMAPDLWLLEDDGGPFLCVWHAPPPAAEPASLNCPDASGRVSSLRLSGFQAGFLAARHQSHP